VYVDDVVEGKSPRWASSVAVRPTGHRERAPQALKHGGAI